MTVRFYIGLISLFVLAISCNEQGEASFIITNGSIIDGSNKEAYTGDIVVIDDEIVYIGSDHNYQATTIIDADGRVITPGFIDPHSHGDPFKTPEFNNFLSQGITTITLGQDGSGPTSIDFSSWFNLMDSINLGVNVATLIGHGTIRRMAGIADDKAPDESAMAIMEGLLSSGMSYGAFGMSTGLEYIPGYYSKEDELISLAIIVGKNDGIIMSHNRNEDDYAVNESVRELIRQGEFCRVQVSHMKVVYGKGSERAEELLNILDSARNAGIEVYADVYPYIASYTGIGIVFPDWAKAPNDFDVVKRDRRVELKEFLIERVNYRNGPEATLFGTAPWAGKTLKQVADSLGKDFADVLIDNIGPTGASGAYFVMNEELQERLLQEEYVMVCTDGSPTMRHPRGYGSNAKVIKEYVGQKTLFSLPTAVYKMSGLPASTLGIVDRGLIKEGYKADILIFSPDEINDPANFQDPFQLSTGFDWIIVNGKLVMEEGKKLTVLAGKLVRKDS